MQTGHEEQPRGPWEDAAIALLQHTQRFLDPIAMRAALLIRDQLRVGVRVRIALQRDLVHHRVRELARAL